MWSATARSQVERYCAFASGALLRVRMEARQMRSATHGHTHACSAMRFLGCMPSAVLFFAREWRRASCSVMLLARIKRTKSSSAYSHAPHILT